MISLCFNRFFTAFSAYITHQKVHSKKRKFNGLPSIGGIYDGKA